MTMTGLSRTAAVAAILAGTSAGATITTVSHISSGAFDFLAPATTDYNVVIAGAARGNSYANQNGAYCTSSAYGGTGAIAFGTFQLDAVMLPELNVARRQWRG